MYYIQTHIVHLLYSSSHAMNEKEKGGFDQRWQKKISALIPYLQNAREKEREEKNEKQRNKKNRAPED